MLAIEETPIKAHPAIIMVVLMNATFDVVLGCFPTLFLR